jgi:glutathione synthase
MKQAIAVVMDPIESIYPEKDSSFALMLEAQRRAWDIYYLQIKDLWVRDGVAYAQTQKIRVHDDANHWFDCLQQETKALHEFNMIFLRTDPPVHAEYITATHILDLAQSAGALVVNHPQSIRDANEKLFISQFPQCCAPTLVAADQQLLQNFIAEQTEVILKPLDGMGGSRIFHVRHGDTNIKVILEVLTQTGQTAIMAQRYLAAVQDGDKRIIMLNGKPVPYALARIPQNGEIRANLAAGGRGEVRALNARDQWIAEQVGPTLAARGLYWVGLDVIGDYLTEINVTSPTCIRQLDAAMQLNIAGLLLDELLQLVKRKV